MLRSGFLALCLLGLFVGPSVAHALPTGGIFSGPARSTGSAMYWNPASLSADTSEFTVKAELTGLTLHASFQRDGVDPFTQEPFALSEFSTQAPDFGIAISRQVLWPWLKVIGGVFSPLALGAKWPAQGAQRYHLTNATFYTIAGVAGVSVGEPGHFGIAAVAGPTYSSLHFENSLDFGVYANDAIGANLFTAEDPSMEAKVESDASGIGMFASIGAWYRPIENLNIGLSFWLPQEISMEGKVNIYGSDTLNRAVTGFTLNPETKTAFDYPLPWQLHFETEYQYQDFGAAFIYQYSNKSSRRILQVQLYEADPDFLNGTLISSSGAVDDWFAGLRLFHVINEQWTAGVRADFDPRYVPTETYHAGNLDFANIDFGVGARWHVAKGITLSANYYFFYAKPVTVDDSLLNPYAPRSSGLGLPSGNGTYTARAHRLNIGFDGSW